jgi:hypothetical protein
MMKNKIFTVIIGISLFSTSHGVAMNEDVQLELRQPKNTIKGSRYTFTKLSHETALYHYLEGITPTDAIVIAETSRFRINSSVQYTFHFALQLPERVGRTDLVLRSDRDKQMNINLWNVRYPSAHSGAIDKRFTDSKEDVYMALIVSGIQSGAIDGKANFKIQKKDSRHNELKK